MEAAVAVSCCGKGTVLTHVGEASPHWGQCPRALQETDAPVRKMKHDSILQAEGR